MTEREREVHYTPAKKEQPASRFVENVLIKSKKDSLKIAGNMPVWSVSLAHTHTHIYTMYSNSHVLSVRGTLASLYRSVCLSSHIPGIVPSSVVLTGFQVMSRVFLTWAVTHSVREVRVSLSFLTCISLV